MRKTIGIIGFGNMGSAIGERLKTKYRVLAFDKDKNKTKDILGINVAESAVDLVNKVDTVILAVKPQGFECLLGEIKDYAKQKLLISIAAGITTAYIEKRLFGGRVIRVMPNLPARIGKGMICLCRGRSSNEKDLTITEQLFKNLGETLILDENMMDAATAVSGSGPGYLCAWCEGKDIGEIKKFVREKFTPSLTTSAQSVGFTPEEAKLLAETTGGGSVIFLEETKLSPLELKKQVTSKGGTTEAGLEVLHKGGSLEEAVKAALKRAKELSLGE